MSGNSEVISTLNGLISACRDGQHGFATAADAAESAELKSLFTTYSQQRAAFAGELRDEVRRLGGEAADSGSVTGAVHRGWMEVKAAATGRDDASILEECERGEGAALASYRSALGVDMPAGVRAIVERQFTEVKQAHERMTSMRRASGAGA
ncbi:MAG TPA: PA2169 family four-helix-bundle protein [Pyrinomonadaceae bacterium]|nr:PA2169 family four-helix-bundle protein [Pyrinomonadaceae bacterium]